MSLEQSIPSEHFFQQQKGKLTAALISYFGPKLADDIEDIIQDTFLAALKSWPTNPPNSHEGWLVAVAKNKAINLLRKKNRLEQLTVDQVASDLEARLEAKEAEDSQLHLLLTFMDYDWSTRKVLIMSLKVIGGFDGRSISKALLIKRDTVFKTYQRAIKELETIPDRHGKLELTDQRLNTIHKVIYLLFNEGFQALPENLDRSIDLCHLAFYLGKILRKRSLANSDTYALLALMYFHMSRHDSRKDGTGDMLLLSEQDRKLWDSEMIQEGFKLLQQSIGGQRLSTYHLEAGIASLHCSSPSFEKTNWKRILWYYDRLALLSASPIVRLNQLIARYFHGDRHELFTDLLQLGEDNLMQTYHLFHSFVGKIKEEQDDIQGAVSSYQTAIQLTHSVVEQSFLRRKIENLLVS
ncbi:MAG: sigma-70 family RNA polymerase sigma factor [Cyclobacteriaceae bacterium]|nr:sigma-70 family RNA polymerase sigma factor [Cyclobacteriaceae bacterium HetDA_MAG_MS6]